MLSSKIVRNKGYRDAEYEEYGNKITIYVKILIFEKLQLP
jgi:hypothetical protein